MRLSRKTILTTGLLLLLVFAVFYGISYLLSLRTLVVNFQNIDKVSVYSTKALDGGDSEKPIREITSSGQEVKLKKGSYTLKYDAAENYQDLFVEIDLSEKRQAVDLVPNFNEEYLNKQLDGELASIKQAILAENPKINGLYEIQRGRLYQNGEWYGTTLVFIGPVQNSIELFRTDTLRIVLKKEGNYWKVKTHPPDIVLTKYAYPDIPVEVLKEVNVLPIPTEGE